jgi:hypothetical protein
MKFLRIALLGIATSFATFAQAQTADEIVNKHIDAIGGAANWKKVNSVVQEGTMTVQGSIQVDVKVTALNGKGARTDIAAMGMNGYQIITPGAGWGYMPFGGQTKAEPYTADQVKDGVDELDTQGTLVDYKTKGHNVTLIGKEDVDGVEAHKLQLTLKGGKVQTLFVDPKTFYIIKMVSKQNVNGQEIEQSTTLSNYKKLPEGIVVPMSISTQMGELVINKVEINKPVDETIFKPSN